MGYHEKIRKAAIAEGLDPDQISPSTYRRLALQVREPLTALKDAATAIGSAINVTLKLKVVSLAIAGDNLNVCKKNKCGKYTELKDGTPLCAACTCSGKLLIAKTRDARMHCPQTDPDTQQYYWDNRGKESTEVEEKKPEGDAKAG